MLKKINVPTVVVALVGAAALIWASNNVDPIEDAIG